MKDTCDCGTPLDMVKGKGFTFVACPKGHYERHEATGKNLESSDWLKDMMGWQMAPVPAPAPRRGYSIADQMVREAVAWAEGELKALQHDFPVALQLQGWADAQTELEKLATNSGVLEIEDAIANYKQRVTAYLGKWRKKLQSQSQK